MGISKACLIISVLLSVFLVKINGKTLESEAKNYIEEINADLMALYKLESRQNWIYEVFHDDQFLEEVDKATSNRENYLKTVSNNLYKYIQNMKEFKSPELKRKIHRLRKPNYNVLSDKDYAELNDVLYDMKEFYMSVKICSYQNKTNCNLTLIPDVQDILSSSNDLDEILYYWLEWREQTGQRVQKSFETFIDLYKKAAKANNITIPSDMWYYDFDTENAPKRVEDIMTSIQPLFKQFHAHIRYLLKKKYGEEVIKSDEPYPQHLAEILLGESYRYEDGGSDLEFPFTKKILPNITESLIERNFTPEKMFDLTREFFVSLGMTELPSTFWTNRAFPVANPNSRILSCWNKAWNFYAHNEIEFTYCPNVDFRHFLNMHEAVAEAYTYHYYQDQPVIFQSESLPTFSEAIGNIISLSVSSPRYLKKVGAIPENSFDNETQLNRLYLRGMQNVFLLPVLHVLDKYRIEILDNTIKSWDNCAYWKLNEKYTGSRPPVMRNNNQFDAPAKLLVAADEEYSSLIITTIMQFQVYKHFCKKVGQYIPNDPEYPLDNCDLSGHTVVGDALKKAMKLGASRSWRQVLRTLTGTYKLDTSGFLEFFRPLFDWLTETNKKNNVKIGWKEVSYCS